MAHYENPNSTFQILAPGHTSLRINGPIFRRTVHVLAPGFHMHSGPPNPSMTADLFAGPFD